MRTRMLIATGLVGFAGIVGAACSSDDDSTITGATGDETVAEHNDADVTFAQEMIPHHRQAVEMAQLATDRAQDPRVLDLASRIEGAQDPEITQMSGWLEDWDEDVPEAGGHEGMTGMTGMMSAEDMDELEAASGAAFDEMFLTMMIEHHRGAVEMATTELDDGQFPEALELAQTIIDAQNAEITEMEQILAGDGDGSTTSTVADENPAMDGMG